MISLKSLQAQTIVWFYDHVLQSTFVLQRLPALEGFTYNQCLAWLQNCQYAKQGLVLLCASIYQKKQEKTLPRILLRIPHDGKGCSSTRAAPEHLCSAR